jgi:Ser/Thr protein kinase RdoA (MazF antagonist)
MSVFSTPPPRYSTFEAEQLAKSKFGINGQANPLSSERDQNFLIRSEEDSFILKISNSAESFDELDMQNKVMQHIVKVDPEFELTLPLCSLSGDEIIQIENKGQTNWVRGLKYINGKFLKDSTHDQIILLELGSFLGRLDNAMKDFNHPAAKRTFPWDVRYTDFLKVHKNHINKDRDIIDYYLSKYETHVLPNESYLRKAIIHNDGNDHNVLLDQNGKTTGIIDFGDMVYSYIALEPAVCMAYIALEKTDTLEVISTILKGYHQAFHLNEYELNSVIFLMCLRLCTLHYYHHGCIPEKTVPRKCLFICIRKSSMGIS